MINCLVVDDEQHAIDVLVHYISQTPYLHLVKSTTSPIEAMQILNMQKIDLVFLDIQMPEISGLDIARTIQGKSKVIMTTAYSEFAAEGFDLEVVDYLLKPIPMPRFFRAVQRVLNMITTSVTISRQEETIDDDYIFVKTEFKGKMLKINLKEIEYIEGMKNYVAIYHAGQKTMALLNMKDLEERLPKKYFFRVHKSYIVSVNKITAVEGNQIVLKNVKAEILLGETYKSGFFDLMKHKLMG
ncbi:LytR/AlgR family response regulator transcription factor [Chitinophaga nivalis]|uniref:LytTR family DNA-binding domain-containing protein n=1 Tax=Chitinophaga nivalis TaxID=2991709 RepID=A0ABT3IGU6_9BACT|nr:LytTR family DNA-binding domain-containing protein [Chitinophaga nivalis]MCW3467125.1 LytTR family DNA-binding domain-containing protein [Chitinophaga nivalis]MCW3483184.1 LytTR family DNA-binding domain-containing protein [Chitinophaga nivalis]